MKVAIIGAGSWGTACAIQLANNDNDVLIWARRPELAEAINEVHRNVDYLPDIQLPQNIQATCSLEEALAGAEALVLATPSKALRSTCEQIKGLYKQGTSLVLLTKGVENESGLLLLEVINEVLQSGACQAVLSGPNHAEEVALGMLSATVVASRNEHVALLFQELFASDSLRVYTSDDVRGVQLCGAAKNIIAIAAGAAAGRGLGDNAAAVIMTRGLAEISRLVDAVGGQSQTCMGLAGMGDLIATCTSPHSRNRSFGEALAAGDTISSYEEKTHMVVEGALACKSVVFLAHKHDVELPLCEMVERVVWQGESLEKMTTLLMSRPAKPEFY